MPEAIRLGMLTPSSNTVLEPMTTAMLSGCQMSRLISAVSRSLRLRSPTSSDRQFDEDEILRAADLLAHAQGQCHRVEWDVGELAGLRARRAALRADRRRDRSRRLHVGPGLPGNLPAYRRFARRAGHALCRRRAGENNRQLAQGRRVLSGRAPLWPSRQFRVRRGL